MYHVTRHMKHVEINVRRIFTHSAICQKSYYDTLGVSPKATQADIKSAYYKLSMAHHPDKNKDSEEAATKFRHLSEAYEVLGNVRTRKLYDRGLYIENRDLGNYEDIPLNKFYRSRDTKSRPPAAYGRTTVYDFDEWSRAHYGVTFQRGIRYRQKQRSKEQYEKQSSEDEKSERTMFLIGVLLFGFAYMFYGKDIHNPDKVVTFGTSVVGITRSDEK